MFQIPLRFKNIWSLIEEDLKCLPLEFLGSFENFSVVSFIFKVKKDIQETTIFIAAPLISVPIFLFQYRRSDHLIFAVKTDPYPMGNQIINTGINHTKVSQGKKSRN